MTVAVIATIFENLAIHRLRTWESVPQPRAENVAIGAVCAVITAKRPRLRTPALRAAAITGNHGIGVWIGGRNISAQSVFQLRNALIQLSHFGIKIVNFFAFHRIQIALAHAAGDRV